MVEKNNKAQNESINGAQKNDAIQEKLSTSDLESTSKEDLLFSGLKSFSNQIDLVKTPIFLTYNAYRRMICYALRYAREDIPEKNWKEVYGILIGSIGINSELIVKDAIPMIVGDRAGVKYESKQYVDMAEINESVYEKSIQDKKTDFIIGWWHTHPGFKFMFSNIDIQTQLGYQIPNPYAIGLIFNHTELKSVDYYLGLAALRLINPNRGILATYDYITIKTELEKKVMVTTVEEEIRNVKKNVEKVIKELKYIEQVLRKRYLAQLQRNYGLIMIPKDEIKLTNDPHEAEDDERILYEWDPEFYKKRYRIPKFREKVENNITTYEKKLHEIRNSSDLKTFETQKKNFRKKIKNLLREPLNWLNKINHEFTKRVEIISPYFDYLDTNERKIIETFESKSSEYRTIYDDLEKRAEFDI
jgi:proteasome lid subunit RPN8/RPN11